jgi:hypothetical protein
LTTRDRFVDPRVNAERQTVLSRVDLLDEVWQRFAFVAEHVQDRPEDFLRELRQALDLDQRRRHETAPRRRHEAATSRRALHATRRLRHAPSPLAHRRDVPLDAGPRFVVDHRAHIDAEQARVPDLQLGDRSVQHRDEPIGTVPLHAEGPQRRAALANAVEG